MSIPDILLVLPTPLWKREERVSQLKLTYLGDIEKLPYEKPTGSPRKSYAVTALFHVGSITSHLFLSETMDKLDLEMVIWITTEPEITVYILNREKNFGDETVTVVECNLNEQKPCKAMRGIWNGQQDGKGDARTTCEHPLNLPTMTQHPVCTAQDASENQTCNWVPTALSGATGEAVSLMSAELFVVEKLPTTNTGQPQNVCETFRGWPYCFDRLRVTRPLLLGRSPQRGSQTGIRELPQRKHQRQGLSQTRLPQLHSRTASGKGSGPRRPHHQREPYPGGHSHSPGSPC